MTDRTKTFFLFLLIVVCGGLLPRAGAQTTGLQKIAGAITYVTPGSVYFNAGSNVGLAIGDTLVASHGTNALGKVVISAISSSSSAAQVLPGAAAIAIGDTVSMMKHVEPKVLAEAETGRASRGWTPPEPTDNYVTGRIAAQYAGAGVLGSSMDFSQPSLLLRLGIERLFGTGLRFTLNGRAYRDMGAYATRYGTSSQTATRIYELNVTSDDPRTPIGFSLGRIISPFLGGLGQFDGGQVYAKSGQFSFGLAAGTQANPLNSSFETGYQKAALFVNYAVDREDFRGTEMTVAYGQQMNHWNFDRDFLYTQLAIRTTGPVSFYESSEFDLHDISNGIKVSRFHLTNVFMNVSYTPVRWASLSAGYDANRSIYLFESMKTVPDTLLDRNLQQGVRGGLTFRLPSTILLMFNGTYRPGTGSQRNAKNGNATVRMSDIAASGINAGLRYTLTKGVYTNGNGFAFDIDRWLSSSITVGARLDQYTYDILVSGERLKTTTLTLNSSLRLSRSWYLLVNFDQLWDSLRNAQRIYAEIGMHF
jgi:hypothetical protein